MSSSCLLAENAREHSMNYNYFYAVYLKAAQK